MITGITLRGNAGGNKLSGAAGNDTFHGAGGDDDLAGNGGNDSLFGDDGLDRLLGHDGNDVLYGGNGNDMLSGGAGNDTIDGGAGNDSIEGGTDADVMTGGTGADLFFYRYGNFGPDILSSMDTITDFSASEGDTISLRLVDAKTDTAADDGFTFIGSQAFQGVAGELRYEATGSGIVAQGDRNGDGVADMAIQLLGVAFISGSNFVL
jgi:Ca2+-binding RTX toxin-like protein